MTNTPPESTDYLLNTPLFDWVAIGEVMLGSHQTADGMKETVSGDVFNTAAILAQHGQRVAFYTAIGHDAATTRIQEAIREANVFEHFVFTHPQRPNGFYVTRDGATSYDRNRSAATALISEFGLSLASLLETTRGVFLSGVTLAVCEESLPYFVALFKEAREAGVITALDANYRAELWRSPEHAWAVMSELLPYTDVFLPSLDDMTALLGVTSPNAVLEALKPLELPMMAMTLGADGARVDSQQLSWQADVRTVYPDAWMLGAGDAFNGGFLAAWVEGESVESALKAGIAATENAFFLRVMNERPDPLDNPAQFFETDELAHAM
jgi:2-dehydro-3-deoxygluconokinase